MMTDSAISVALKLPSRWDESATLTWVEVITGCRKLHGEVDESISWIYFPRQLIAFIAVTRHACDGYA